MMKLGMAAELKKDDIWIPPPIATHITEDNESSDESDDESESEVVDDDCHDPFVNATDDLSEISEDIEKLHSCNAVHMEVKTKAINRSRQKPPFVKNNDPEDLQMGIPVYKKRNDKESSDDQSQFLKLEIDGRDDVYIRKRTAVWLLQNTERVSADRLFRVRSNQPFAVKKNQSSCCIDETAPITAKHITVGDLCVFKGKIANNFKIGRVMHFIKIGKTGKQAQYKGKCTEINNETDVSVMCTTYDYNNDLKICTLSSLSYEYFLVKNYLCTLTSCCVINPDCSVAKGKASYFKSSIINVSDKFTLADNCIEHIFKIAR